MHSTFFFASLALPLAAFAAPTPLDALWPRQDAGNCSLSNVQQPSNTMTAPTADMSLVLIALGRGTQNYTCAAPTSTPSAIGAVATLFNASCAVASNDLDSLQDAQSIGAHFFVDTTTPDFDIVGLGNTQAKKAESMAAPQATNVPWLRLEAQKQGTTSQVREIYRLNTKGGVAPADCSGQAAGSTLTVAYEAQYWIYASSS